MAETAWWVSWYHEPDDGVFEYHGPWWVSGYDYDGRVVVVAAVHATSERAAWDTVQATYDAPPEDIDRRFCEPLTREPWSDRFPRADWMQWPVVEPKPFPPQEARDDRA